MATQESGYFFGLGLRPLGSMLRQRYQDPTATADDLSQTGADEARIYGMHVSWE